MSQVGALSSGPVTSHPDPPPVVRSEYSLIDPCVTSLGLPPDISMIFASPRVLRDTSHDLLSHLQLLTVGRAPLSHSNRLLIESWLAVLRAGFVCDSTQSFFRVPFLEMTLVEREGVDDSRAFQLRLDSFVAEVETTTVSSKKVAEQLELARAFISIWLDASVLVSRLFKFFREVTGSNRFMDALEAIYDDVVRGHARLLSSLARVEGISTIPISDLGQSEAVAAKDGNRFTGRRMVLEDTDELRMGRCIRRCVAAMQHQSTPAYMPTPSHLANGPTYIFIDIDALLPPRAIREKAFQQCRIIASRHHKDRMSDIRSYFDEARESLTVPSFVLRELESLRVSIEDHLSSSPSILEQCWRLLREFFSSKPRSDHGQFASWRKLYIMTNSFISGADRLQFCMILVLATGLGGFFSLESFISVPLVDWCSENRESIDKDNCYDMVVLGGCRESGLQAKEVGVRYLPLLDEVDYHSLYHIRHIFSTPLQKHLCPS